MLPVKKRFSHPDVASPASPAKRTKLSPPRESDFINLQNMRMQQLVALRQSVQASAFPPIVPRAAFMPDMEARKRFSNPDYYCRETASPRFVSPESATAPIAVDREALPQPPFRARPAGWRRESAKASPLDLLSSVSTYVAGASVPGSTRHVASVPPSSRPVPLAKPAPATAEKYLGQRHPLTHLRHGKGIMKYSNGCRYVGTFSHDKRSGYGRCWYPNGSVYSGEWSEGKRCGKGRMEYANGDCYEGEWTGDFVRGKGVYYYMDGTIDVGRFEEERVKGCRWSKDRRMVWRLGGGDVERISVEEGRRIVVGLGLDFGML